MIHLWLFFMLLVALFREEKDWQRLFVIAIIGGLGMALYGLLAGTGTENFIGPKFGSPDFRFQGSIGNPAYVAAYAIFMLFYTGYLLASKYKKQLFSFGASALWFLIAIFTVVFFAAATRGAFLGLFAALMVLIGYNIFYAGRKWRIRLVAATVIILLAVGLLIQFRNVPLIKAIPGSRIFDISFSAETFQTRFIMWGVALKGWQERPIFGWGPENFLQVFEKHFNLDYVRAVKGQYFEWYDRAHSIYFDYLAETGALGLLSFLGIFGVFYWQFFKTRMNTDKNTDEHRLENIRVNPLSHPRESVLIKGLLFALPVAYLVQGIVLFDVLPIYMNVFLFLAFASYYFNKTPNPNR